MAGTKLEVGWIEQEFIYPIEVHGIYVCSKLIRTSKKTEIYHEKIKVSYESKFMKLAPVW